MCGPTLRLTVDFIPFIRQQFPEISVLSRPFITPLKKICFATPSQTLSLVEANPNTKPAPVAEGF